jgi:hypothetical protein
MNVNYNCSADDSLTLFRREFSAPSDVNPRLRHVGKELRLGVFARRQGRDSKQSHRCVIQLCGTVRSGVADLPADAIAIRDWTGSPAVVSPEKVQTNVDGGFRHLVIIPDRVSFRNTGAGEESSS